jgi:cytochrome c-type biogenesis protein
MNKQEIIFLNSVFFVLGFVIVFSILGILLQTLLLKTAHTLMGILTLVGGSIIILFGAALILSTKYFIPFFTSEYKIHVKRFSSTYISSFVFGLAFAIGWTPCVGPILGSIYALAITAPGISFLLLLSYALGLGIPFLIAGALISKVSPFMNKIKPFLKYFNIISGIFLITMGLLVITGYIGMLSIFIFSLGGNSFSGSLNFAIAIFAGILTFLSPCILPIVPAYLSYIGNSAVSG